MGKTTARTRTHGSSIDPNPQKDTAGPSRKAAGNGKKEEKREAILPLQMLRSKPIAPIFGVAQSGRQNSTIKSP